VDGWWGGLEEGVTGWRWAEGLLVGDLLYCQGDKFFGDMDEGSRGSDTTGGGGSGI